jgi:chorismate mutase
MKKTNELFEYRREIDNLDRKILSCLLLRLKCAQKIAVIKQKHGVKIYDGKRENEVLLRLQIAAEKKRLNPSFIKGMYKLIFKESKRIQSLTKKGEIDKI